MNEKIEWSKMNRWELEQRSELVDLAILPIGSLEQHGPHLPLDTDSFIAKHMVKEAVKKLDSEKPPILPTIPYGVSERHMTFPGTVTLSSNILEEIIIDIGRSIIQHGFRSLYIYSGHIESLAPIENAARELKKETGMIVYYDSMESMEHVGEKIIKCDNDAHAGEVETSLSLALRNDLVDERTIPDKEHDFPDTKVEFDNKTRLDYTWKVYEISPTGIIGDATEADKEKGEKLWEIGVKELKERLETVLDLETDLR